MLSQTDHRAETINRQIAESEAGDLETLADQVDIWKGQLEDMYRLGLTDAAAGLHDGLSDLVGKLRREADGLRE